MRTLRVGLAAGIVAAALTGAAAQEAAGPPRGTEDCPLVGCPLGAREPASAQQPAAPRTVAAPAVAATSPAGDATVSKGGDAGKVAHVAPVAMRAAVTVAADEAAASRLKALAAARPRRRLHPVAPGTADAELTLAPSLDAASGSNALHLYSEQLLVVAGPTVGGLSDLAGRPVSFGESGDPAAVIARRAFAAAGIAVRETPLDTANALDGVATGDLDAVVVLAPQPASALAKLRAPTLHLVDWPEGASLPTGARLQRLAAATYPGLTRGDIRVVAVDAVLTLTPRGERSAAARRLFASLRQRTGSLARRGFDRLGADLAARRGRRLASDERR